MRPFVAVIYAEVTAPVVRAQTPPLLAALRSQGTRVDAAVFTSPRAILPGASRSAHRRALAAIAAATGVKPVAKTYMPRDRGLAPLGVALAKSLRSRGLGDAVLFCRQPRAAIAGIAARSALRGTPRVVLDLRGIRDVEYLMTLGHGEASLSAGECAQLAVYRNQEETACRGADAVLCVSRPMEKLVLQRYGVADGVVGHVPNHADAVPDAEESRASARKSLGVADDAILVAYSGTLAAWQMPDASIGLFQAVQALRHDARLLFLTTEQDKALKSLAASGTEGAIVRSAPPGEAARLLCAADYGLLLREDDVVNRVACPVKFGEYLACGVRPILSPHIGDQSRLCEETGLGVIVGLASPVDAARIVVHDAARRGALGPEGRAARRAWATEHISPARAAKRVAEFLERTVPAG